jgi:tellurite methyltransferase
MSGVSPESTVSPFVAAWLPLVAAAMQTDGKPRRALDLAVGEGRHAVPLALSGFVTFGVDRSVQRLIKARGIARERGVSFVLWAADLDTYPLPASRFDLLFCTRFLLRARWDDLKGTVKPGGFVVYETFTTGQIVLGRGPSSPDHLLYPGELRAAFQDWDVLFAEEVDAPAAMARLVARKPLERRTSPAQEGGRS